MENHKPADIVGQDAIYTEKTIVLVTNQFQCERIIHAGRLIADISKTDLLVLNVQDSKYAPNPEAIEYLFQISQQENAVMQVTYSNNPSKAINDFLKKYKTQNVLSGIPSSRSSVLQKLWNKFTHVRFFVVDAEGVAQEVGKNQFSFSSLPPA